MCIYHDRNVTTPTTNPHSRYPSDVFCYELRPKPDINLQHIFIMSEFKPMVGRILEASGNDGGRLQHRDVCNSGEDQNFD